MGSTGSGKTTTAAKLALTLRKSGQRPLMVAADTRRPAAITQLEVLGRQLDVPVHSEGDKVPPPKISANAVKRARESAHSAGAPWRGRSSLDAVELMNIGWKVLIPLGMIFVLINAVVGITKN